MKPTKKLLTAIICLIVSLALCVWACFAWFTVNHAVRSDAIASDVVGSDIVSFDVNAYYLDRSSDGGYVTAPDGDMHNGSAILTLTGGNIHVDDGNDGALSGEDDKMRPYGGSDDYATAVLFVIDYSLKTSAVKNYRITASCTSSLVTVSKVSEDSYESGLSNVVYFTNDLSSSAQSDGYGVTVNDGYATKVLYDSGTNRKNTKITLLDGIQPETANGSDAGRYNGTAFVLMDYYKDAFTYISSLMLQNGGSLSSSLSFNGDLIIGIEEYEPGTVVRPMQISLDKDCVTVQTAGADVLSSAWRFNVTYSDGTVESVAATDSRISVSGMDTQTVGSNRRATVTFTDANGYSTTGSVVYTVTSAEQSSAVRDGVYLFDNGSGDGSANEDAGFTIVRSSGTVNYDSTAYTADETYTKTLKVESATSVTFTVDGTKEITLIECGGGTFTVKDGAGNAVTVTQDATATYLYTFTVEAGTYVINRTSGSVRLAKITVVSA